MSVFCYGEFFSFSPDSHAPSVITNLESASFPVSPNYPGRNTECVEILGILGNDILQDFIEFDLIHVELFRFKVRAIKLANGIIPFGSVENFIHPSERRKFVKCLTQSGKPGVNVIQEVEPGRIKIDSFFLIEQN